MKMATVGGRNM